jgi:hypothetical protein
MPLAPEVRLGVYEVLGLTGAGGGEVYRARDTAATQIIVVQNWFEELKRLVPSGKQ